MTDDVVARLRRLAEKARHDEQPEDYADLADALDPATVTALLDVVEAARRFTELSEKPYRRRPLAEFIDEENDRFLTLQRALDRLNTTEAHDHA